MAAMGACILLAVLLFEVPLRGSPLTLIAVSAAFMCPVLGQGLLISTVARNQFVASQVAIISGFMPAFLLSGVIFEIASMPLPIRLLTFIVPARYFVSSLQTILLAGDVWALLLPNVAAMLTMGVLLIALTAHNTRKRLS